MLSDSLMSSGAGAANWVSMYAQSDVRTYRTPWFGGTPWEKDAPLDVYWDHSPLKYVSNVTTPTLFLVGQEDVRVPPPQSVEMWRGVKQQGVETHLYVAPREPHGWRELRHRLFKPKARPRACRLLAVAPSDFHRDHRRHERQRAGVVAVDQHEGLVREVGHGPRVDVGERPVHRQGCGQARVVKPAAAVVRALRPGLHLLETEVDDFDVRAAVVLGTKGAVVFDTLAHPVHMGGDEVLAGDLPVTVVYSHADWDHVWGTGGLAGFAEIVALEAAAGRFSADVPRELGARREREPGTWDDVVLVGPTRTFETASAVEIGGITVELEALPGHTPDCLVGFIPEWGVLLAGDTVETPLPVVNDGTAVASWAEGLARWWADSRVVQVVPSHGPVGGRERIGQTLDYLRSLTGGGDPPEVTQVSPFYLETHLRNLRAVGRLPSGPI